MLDVRSKKELAEGILKRLLDNGMIELQYGTEFYKEGKEEIEEEIKRILEDYLVIEGGRVIE